MAVAPPNGNEQHIVRTINYTAPRWDPNAGDSESINMLEAQFAPKPGQTWTRHYNCLKCRFTYPKGEVKLVGGAAYSYALRCTEHIKDTGGIKEQ